MSIELRKASDSGKVALFGGTAQVGLGFFDAFGQPFPLQMHESGIVQAAHFTSFGRLHKELTRFLWINGPALTCAVHGPNRNLGPGVAVIGSLFIPFGRELVIDGDAKSLIMQISHRKLRRRNTLLRGKPIPTMCFLVILGDAKAPPIYFAENGLSLDLS